MSIQSGIAAVIAAKGGHALQERVAAQVHARLDGAREAGLLMTGPSSQPTKTGPAV